MVFALVNSVVANIVGFASVILSKVSMAKSIFGVFKNIFGYLFLKVRTVDVTFLKLSNDMFIDGINESDGRQCPKTLKSLSCKIIFGRKKQHNGFCLCTAE